MSNKAKKKRNKKKHIANKPHFMGLGNDNQLQNSDFSSSQAKDNKPILRRTTSK